jgi:hypothetical protein
MDYAPHHNTIKRAAVVRQLCLQSVFAVAFAASDYLARH